MKKCLRPQCKKLIPISARLNSKYCTVKCRNIASMESKKLRNGDELEILKKQIEDNRFVDRLLAEYLKEREAILLKEKEITLLEYETLEMKKQIVVMREMSLDYKPKIILE